MVGDTMMDLQTIRRDIEEGTEDARFGAWLAWYHADTEPVRRAWEQLVRGGDPILKVLCCRFLAHMADARAIQTLQEFMLDANPVVFRAATQAFSENRYAQKDRHLLPLLTTDLGPALHFAIDQLAKGGEHESLDYLLALLPNADEALLLHVLRALRHFPESRLLLEMRPWLADARAPIRVHAILVVGAVYAAGSAAAHARLAAAVTDAHAAVRQAAIWSLCQRPRRRDVTLLLARLTADADARVQAECLRGLAHFPNVHVVATLVRLAATTTAHALALGAEGILLSLPPRLVARGVRTLYDAPEIAVRSKAILLGVQVERRVAWMLRWLTSALHRAGTEREQLLYIEALGVLGEPRAIAVLEPLLAATPLVAYAALGALLQLLPVTAPERLLPYLACPRATLQQQVLRALARRVVLGRADAIAVAPLRPFLQSSAMNLCYLAIQVLARIGDAAMVPEIGARLAAEPDASVRARFIEAAQPLLVRHAPAVIQWLRTANVADDVVVACLHVYRVVEPTVVAWDPFVEALFAEPWDAGGVAFATYAVPLVVALLSAGRLDMTRLLGWLLETDVRREWLARLVPALQDTSIQLQLPIDQMVTWMDTHTDATRRVLIEALSFSPQAEAVQWLAARLGDETWVPWHAEIGAALRRILANAA